VLTLVDLLQGRERGKDQLLPRPAPPLGQLLEEGLDLTDDKKSFRSLPSRKSTRLAKRLSERPRL
jgi:hypothetical protein